MDVYFVPGMSANCKIFDNINLPEGFDKKYIEWKIPQEDETLEDYSHRMASEVDTSRPFILVGYSLGGLVVQEMNKFIRPEKNILIASMKSETEIPAMFRLGRRIHFAHHFPVDSIMNNKIVVDFLARFVYGTKPNEAAMYISCTDPVYTKWATQCILDWHPTIACPNLYHIHGLRDQVFPAKNIQNAYMIAKGDHLMVIKRYKEVNQVLRDILLEKTA